MQDENDYIRTKLDNVSKKWQLERRLSRKEIHLPAKSQDCDTLQFGNIWKKTWILRGEELE